MVKSLANWFVTLYRLQHRAFFFKWRKDGNVLFNDALNTFYLRLYGVRHVVKDHSERFCHIGYSFRVAGRVLLYASSHRQDNTYHSLCYTSRGALAWTRNSSMGLPWSIDPTTHRTMSVRSYHGARMGIRPLPMKTYYLIVLEITADVWVPKTVWLNLKWIEARWKNR